MSVCFSDTVPGTHASCFSPNGIYFASIVKSRVVVRSKETLEVAAIFACDDVVSRLEFSPDSQYLMCAQYKRGLVQVFAVQDPQWSARIEEGSAGLIFARWSSDSRHVLTVCEFHVRISIWSLLDKSVRYIHMPKFASSGLQFSPDGKYVAFAERRDCKDSISIVTCDCWELVHNFPVETKDLTDLRWGTDSATIVVWDTILEYQLFAYMMDGRRIARYSAYESALGVKSVAWSPCGQFLAVGSFDQVVRLLNHVTWKPMAEYLHTHTITDSLFSSPDSCAIFHEISTTVVNEDPSSLYSSSSDLSAKAVTSSKYVVEEAPYTLPFTKPDPERGLKHGVGVLQWSPDSRFLATRNDNMPETIWIWDTSLLSLAAVLVQRDPVRSFRWKPVFPSSRSDTRSSGNASYVLAIACGGPRLFFWSGEGCICVDIPDGDVNAHSIEWNEDGTSLLVVDNAGCCVCYMDNSLDEEPLDSEV